MVPSQELPSWECFYRCGARVAEDGMTCWPCQSYEEYLAGPRCPCPHERGADCVCDEECGEWCPELSYLLYLAELELGADGEEPVKAP